MRICCQFYVYPHSHHHRVLHLSPLRTNSSVNTTPHTSTPSHWSARTCEAQGSSVFVVRASCVMSHLHALMCLFWLSSTTPLSSLCWPSSLLSSCSFSCPSTSSSTMWLTNSMYTLANEDVGTLAEYDPFTGYEPNDYHITEATEPYIQESSVENGFPNDFEYDDVTIGKALSSQLFTQEREDDASRRRAYHSQEEGLLSSQSSSISHDGTVRPVVKPFDSQIPNVWEIPSHSSESEQIRILLERQRKQILADCQAEIRKHEFQADYDRRSIQKLNEMIESQKEEICRAHQRDERLRRDQQLLHEQLLEQNRELREARDESLSEMEEMKRFQGSTFDTIARRKLVEDRDTILELTGKIQELQNEINCMNDSRDFQDAESVRSGQSHVASQPVFSPPRPDPGGVPSRSLGMPSRQNGPPSIWDTHGTSGNVFANPTASSSAPYPQELNPWSSNIYQNTQNHMWWVKAKHQFRIRDASQDRQPEIQSSSVEETLQKNYGARPTTTADLRSSFWQIHHASNISLLEDKIKTEVCTCSQFPTEAMLWIKEVEMVQSVDDVKSSCSVRGTQMPNFEVFDAKSASALNRIIHNTQFKKKGQSGGTKSPKKRTVSFVEDRSLTWSTSTSRSLEPMILPRIMPTYSLLLFEMTIFRNSIRNWTEFCYQWRKSHLMTSWNDCTNWEYERLRNSRPYWNCMTWRLIRRS